MDKIALIRSFRHHNSDHGPADHYMLTGYFPTAGFNPTLNPNNQRPAHGAVIARTLGAARLRAALRLPAQDAPQHRLGLPRPRRRPVRHRRRSQRPRFRRARPGAAARRRCRPASTPARNCWPAWTASSSPPRPAPITTPSTVGVFQQKAFELMTSPEAKKAFDIHAEADALRDEYGRNTLGQSCLMARRLVQAGVRCVTIDHSNWDTHDGNFRVRSRSNCCPSWTPPCPRCSATWPTAACSTRTLVIVTGEFGRTPRVNKNAGRDHWGPAFTVALGGGGVKGGRVVGKSDARAEKPADDPYGPEDLAATLYHLLGIDPEEEFYTPEGRPVKIVNNGRIMQAIL